MLVLFWIHWSQRGRTVRMGGMYLFFKEKKHNISVGHVMKWFLSDKASKKNYFVTGFEIDFLQEKHGTVNGIFKEHSISGSDIGTFAISNILRGSLNFNMMKSKRWEFPQYKDIFTLFMLVKKEDYIDITNIYYIL